VKGAYALAEATRTGEKRKRLECGQRVGPTFILPGDVHYQANGVFKRVEVREALRIVTEAKQHLQFFHFFPNVEQHGRFVSTRIGSHDELQHAPRPVAQVLSDRVPFDTRCAPLRTGLW
jgi:hypothetical protein